MNSIDHTLSIKTLVLEALERDKAEDIEVIDLVGKVDFARFAVIATGRSSRHVSSLAEKIVDDLKSSNLVPYGVGLEGLDSKQWVLVDAGDVIVHVFLPETRELYSLTDLYSKWGAAKA